MSSVLHREGTLNFAAKLGSTTGAGTATTTAHSDCGCLSSRCRSLWASSTARAGRARRKGGALLEGRGSVRPIVAVVK